MTRTNPSLLKCLKYVWHEVPGLGNKVRETFRIAIETDEQATARDWKRFEKVKSDESEYKEHCTICGSSEHIYSECDAPGKDEEFRLPYEDTEDENQCYICGDIGHNQYNCNYKIEEYVKKYV